MRQGLLVSGGGGVPKGRVGMLLKGLQADLEDCWPIVLQDAGDAQESR